MISQVHKSHGKSCNAPLHWDAIFVKQLYLCKWFQLPNLGPTRTNWHLKPKIWYKITRRPFLGFVRCPQDSVFDKVGWWWLVGWFQSKGCVCCHFLPILKKCIPSERTVVHVSNQPMLTGENYRVTILQEKLNLLRLH